MDKEQEIRAAEMAELTDKLSKMLTRDLDPKFQYIVVVIDEREKETGYMTGSATRDPTRVWYHLFRACSSMFGPEVAKRISAAMGVGHVQH